MVTLVVTTPQVDWNFVALENLQPVRDPRVRSAAVSGLVSAVGPAERDRQLKDPDMYVFGLVSPIEPHRFPEMRPVACVTGSMH
jgi:hypothetical protein